MTMIKNVSLVMILLLTAFACKEEEDVPTLNKATFEVTIENIQTGKKFMDSGTTGLIMPGESASVSFNAGKGSFFSFATMFVQSNDLFYGFDDSGLALYDAGGNAVTGDVTAQVNLWDAGTEVNEEPGVGANQPPRQSGANTGMDENGSIMMVNDGFTYPSDESVIKVSLTHDGGTMFTVTIENISGSSSVPTPFAPGVWVVHNAAAKLFEVGQPSSAGMEAIAEDGNNSIMSANLMMNSGYASPFAPGVWVIHNDMVNPIFENNTSDKGLGLEALAEDGDPSAIQAATAGLSGVSESGVFNTPSGTTIPGPLMGGDTYSFTFDAEEGAYLSLATMLIHSNDLFFAFGQDGLALFNNGNAVSGDYTTQISLWDAGTEVNEFPGAGNNQPARGGAGTGVDENGNVRMVNDGFTYPAVSQMIKVTITTQ